jgi:DHA1 family bicyclomycin/chloramphenicol resistance-like MFS transporter
MAVTRHPTTAPGQAEFIALIAMLFATVAFSIDAMLPAMPAIAAELSPEAPNRATLILTSFVLGMGLGTFLAGPLSDALGRKPVILWGAGLYVAACLWAILSDSLAAVLAARVLQGVGAAAPRVVGIAIIRDLHAGRQMARIMSFAMTIFTLFPAVAPLIGQGIIALTGWRGIFWAFILFVLIAALWLALRQPETLPPPARTPLSARALGAAAGEVLRHPVVQRAILVQTLLFGSLFGMLSSIQPVFEVTFGRGERFPLWFALIALISASGSLINARLVVRVGMRGMIRRTLDVQMALSALMVAGTFGGLWPEGLGFVVFLVWTMAVFIMAGLTFGNVNAIAMEPMGHVAGTAASVVASVATVGAVVIAAPIGLAFDGTPGPLALGVLVCVTAARLVMRRLPG